MKKIFMGMVVIFIILMVIGVMGINLDKVEQKLSTRIDNIENRDENIRNKINEFAESVKFSFCSNQSYDHHKYGTAFIYNLNGEKVLMTVGHNIVENPSTFFGGCGVTLVGSYKSYSKMDTKEKSDSAMYRYDGKVNAINIPLCDKIEKKSQKVWIIGYPAYTHIPDKEDDSTLTITEGIISGYTSMANGLEQEHLNYFISNNVDTGNSGGPAILETKNGFCLLGIMTWGQKGEHIFQGMVQNIHNVVE